MEAYLHRNLEERLRRAVTRFPVLALAGARQTGKSTLLRELFGRRYRVFTFDPVVDVGNARADPELFLRLNPPPLLLDEVQHAPELLAPLKRVVDERRGEAGLYVLTGSQQLTLLHGLQESLAGRVGLFELHPMSRRELMGQPGPGLLGAMLEARDAGDLLDRLRADPPRRADPGTLLSDVFRGGFPGLVPFDDEELADWFHSYLRTYVERDVAPLRDIGRPQDFSRFVRLLAALSAQELNLSQLGREIGLSPRTARAWLDVAVGSYQAWLLEPWSGNAIKRVSGRPKLHFWDTGFAAALLQISSPAALSAHPCLGALFESWVVGELAKASAALATRPRLWCWRTHGGAEVDLILERDGRLHLIEIKLASHATRHHLRGARAFQQTYPKNAWGPLVVVHGGPDLERLDEDAVAVPATWL